MMNFDKLLEDSFTGVIYKITNIKTNKVYIGQTTTFQKRIADHFRFGANKKESDNYLHRSMRKHGVESFIVTVVISVTTSSYKYLTNTLNDLEIRFISLYNSYHNGYNCTIGGGGARGFKHSVETKRKLSEGKIGKPLSESHKLSLSVAHTGKPHPISAETKLKIGLGNKGRRPSDSCIQKVIERCSKPVIQYSLDKTKVAEYVSLAEAAKYMGCSSAIISYACSKHKKAKNYYWEYKNNAV